MKIRALFGVALLMVSFSQSVSAEESGSTVNAQPSVVTTQLWNQMVKAFKGLNDRVKSLDERVGKLEKSAGKVSSTPASSGEEEVDLTTLDAGSTAPTGSNKAGQKMSHHGVSNGMPAWKVYFDLNFYLRPGLQDLTFDNFHNFLFFEIAPTPELTFTFDVRPQPNFYELDWQALKWLQIRLGKIWIPFDDMAPHNIFGGRINIGRLMPGVPYLPALFTDLGAGLKLTPIDRPEFSLVADVYVVNGFKAGGSDPLNTTGGSDAYPSFNDLDSSADNNRNKSVGVRLKGTFFGKWSIGGSYYTGRWTPQAKEAKYLHIFGGDSQLRLGRTELRVGVSGMRVNLPSGAPGGYYLRGGAYGEVGQKFGSSNQFKILLRGGRLQTDDRIIDENDMTLVGGTFLYRLGPLELQFEHSRDLVKYSGKKNYSFSNIRAVMAF